MRKCGHGALVCDVDAEMARACGNVCRLFTCGGRAELALGFTRGGRFFLSKRPFFQ
jgi:hypothetical protein